MSHWIQSTVCYPKEEQKCKQSAGFVFWTCCVLVYTDKNSWILQLNFSADTKVFCLRNRADANLLWLLCCLSCNIFHTLTGNHLLHINIEKQPLSISTLFCYFPFYLCHCYIRFDKLSLLSWFLSLSFFAFISPSSPFCSLHCLPSVFSHPFSFDNSLPHVSLWTRRVLSLALCWCFMALFCIAITAGRAWKSLVMRRRNRMRWWWWWGKLLCSCMRWYRDTESQGRWTIFWVKRNFFG